MSEVEQATTPIPLQSTSPSDRLVWSGAVRIGRATDIEGVVRELENGTAITTSVSGKLLDRDGRRVAEVYPFTMRTAGCGKEWVERMQEHLVGCVHPVVCQMYARQVSGSNAVSAGGVVDEARAALLGTSGSGGFVWDVSLCVYRTKATSKFVSAPVQEAGFEDETTALRWNEEHNILYASYKRGDTSCSGVLNRLLLKRARLRGALHAIPAFRILKELPIEEQLDILEDDEKIDTFLNNFEKAHKEEEQKNPIS